MSRVAIELILISLLISAVDLKDDFPTSITLNFSQKIIILIPHSNSRRKKD